MASSSVLGVGTVAVRALLAADAALMAAIGSRLYPNPADPPQSGGGQPYVSVESVSELPFNTMGEPNALKWGSLGGINVRISSLSRSEAEIASLLVLVKADLDGKALTLSGYGSAIIEFVAVRTLEDWIGGVKAREWVVEFELTAHQGAA